jgi:hypothetical protein
MGPILMLLGLGLLGGVLLATFIVLLQRVGGRRTAATPLPYRPAPLSTDVINMASIKVAGIGGLGLVAMAAAVALDVPRIGQTVFLGLVLGAGLATVMILRRRDTGSMPSSGRKMGANTTLSIDIAGEPLRRDRRANGEVRLSPRPLPSPY